MGVSDRWVPSLHVEVEGKLGLEAEEGNFVGVGHVAGDVAVVGEAEEDGVLSEGVVAEGLGIAVAAGAEHADELHGPVEGDGFVFVFEGLGAGGLGGAGSGGDFGFRSLLFGVAFLGLGREELGGGGVGEVGGEALRGVAEAEEVVGGVEAEGRHAAARGVGVEEVLGVGDEVVSLGGVELAPGVLRGGLLEADLELPEALRRGEVELF
mmetsp:Transcript_28065/g.90465  ORF Transcript_28065/g.90465 Transcript_28065/m.90465 type:complete len:209 (+) Transcript_28065:296-922(+)